MLNRLVHRQWAASLLIFALPAALAEPLPAPPEEEFLSSLPIVLTPSRLPQPQNEAPAAVTVLDRELIRATGYRDIPRLLRLVPGMQIGQERGHSHWVTYHGMGNDFPSWMQVLVDGRSVFSPANFDGVDWAGLPVTIDEIERIEVVRGTNSAAFGSNAVLGVINIITRHSADQPGNSVAVNGGNAGIADLAFELGTSGGPASLRVSAEIKRDDGFADLNDDHRVAIVSLRSDYRLSDNDELTLRLGGSHGRRGLGYPDSLYDNNAERSAEVDNASLHLQWRHTPGSDEEWMLHYYRNQDEVDEAWTASTTAFGPLILVPLDRNRSSSRDSVELQHRRTWSEAWRTVWGSELRYDRVVSPFLYFGQAEQDDRLARLFGQAEWRVAPQWSLNLSGLFEKYDRDPTHFSPRLFANWQATPEDTWRAGYARAWRQPFMFERYGDVQAHYQNNFLAHPYAPNPELAASRMDSWELGYLSQSRRWDTRFDVRLFKERISKFITRVSHPEDTVPLLSSTLPTARYENLATPITLYGIEYQIDSRPWTGGRVLFSHALIDRRAVEPRITRLSAPYTASLSWLQDWGRGWSSTTTLLRIGPIAGGSGFVPTSDYSAPAYTTVDLRLARSFRLDHHTVDVALVGTNLGGRHQEIADRSEQAMHGNTPVNETSPMVWLNLAVQYR